MRPHAVFLLALTLAHTLAAGLEWRQTEISMEADPMDEEATAVFPFTNTGTAPVEILRVHTSCGCTVPSLAKTIYEPGESGEITATFTFGGRIGHQRKTITVLMAPTPASAKVLTMEVTIPELFQVQPQFVVWRKGEEPGEKSISVRNFFPDRLRIIGVGTQSEAFDVRLEPAGETGLHTVLITPLDTDAAAQARIELKTDQPADDPRVITLYALIR